MGVFKSGMAVVLGLAVCASACGGPSSGAGEAVRPKDPSAAEAIGAEGDASGEGCTKVSPHARPFLADWKTDQRAELESSMQDGIAVLSYDCKGIRVLADCKLAGSYRYGRIPVAAEDLTISQQSDLSATIPLSAAEIRAEILRGLKLELKYALVGRKGAPVREVLKNDLKGSCDGATHFVRAALIGAFQFGTATEGSVGGGAKVLGAGVEGKDRSARELNRNAGVIAACKSKDGDDKPPTDCEHLVQLQLGPVVAKLSATEDDGPQGEQASGKADSVENPCSAGYVLDANGGCKKKSGATAFLCDKKDVAQCVAQCEKGSAESCHNAAVAQYRKDAHPSFDAAREAAQKYYEKGCEKKYMPSCGALAGNVASGKSRDVKRAHELYTKACEGGDANSCLSLATHADMGTLAEDRAKFTPQPTLGFKYTDKACALGGGFACAKLATRYIDGKGVMPNPEQGAKALEKGCRSGNSYTCVLWAEYLATGKAGMTADAAKAASLYHDACEKNNNPTACLGAGQLYAKGATGVKKDPQQAKKYLQHACSNMNWAGACTALAELHEAGDLGKKDAKTALELYEKACPSGKPYPHNGCYGAATLYDKGAEGVSKQPDKAAALFARACNGLSSEGDLGKKACTRAVPLLAKSKQDAQLMSVYSSLCYRYKDKKACTEQDKLRKKVGPSKSSPPPPPGAPPGKPPPPPPGKAPPPPPPPLKK